LTNSSRPEFSNEAQASGTLHRPCVGQWEIDGEHWRTINFAY